MGPAGPPVLVDGKRVGGKLVGGPQPQKGHETGEESYLWGLKKGAHAYPPACKIPKGGIPKDAHVIRVSPCGGERDIVFCAVVKITELTKSSAKGKDAKPELLVDGHGTIEKASGFASYRISDRGWPSSVWAHQRKSEKRIKFCKKKTKRFPSGSQLPKRWCPVPMLHDQLMRSADGMIRDAVARVRFKVAQGKLALWKGKGKSRHA